MYFHVHLSPPPYHPILVIEITVASRNCAQAPSKILVKDLLFSKLSVNFSSKLCQRFYSWIWRQFSLHLCSGVPLFQINLYCSQYSNLKIVACLSGFGQLLLTTKLHFCHVNSFFFILFFILAGFKNNFPHLQCFHQLHISRSGKVLTIKLESHFSDLVHKNSDLDQYKELINAELRFNSSWFILF